MPAYYKCDLSRFIERSASEIIGDLTLANGRNERFQLAPETIEAWRDQLPGLQSGIAYLLREHEAAKSWSILLEYPIPRVDRRIDAVVLAQDTIIVIETKTGKSVTSAERQADDYAIHLACFHEPSANRKIVPLVVSNVPSSRSGARPFARTNIAPPEFATPSNLGRVLTRIIHDQVSTTSPQLNVDEFDAGVFRPIPPIIDAAVCLYSEMEVFEIGHACAAQEDLQRATNSLVNVVRRAKERNEKAICFITGVPGAGKTLVGLNAVHHSDIRNCGAFLSGNGPLVKIIREALIRDVVRRSKNTDKRISRRSAEIKVKTFVQSVHGFAAQHYGDTTPVPRESVIVFDEAQRAWDSVQNARNRRPEVSEAHMMLDVMNRHEGWCVLVALVGGGQEINKGEAGLSEWGRALGQFKHWQVYASPELLRIDASPSFKLFDSSNHDVSITTEPAFHLTVSNRSIRAQRVSDWVDAVLSGAQERAAGIAENMKERPLICRDLSVAREWLRANCRGFTRSGLVCSSSATRLRADGLEPTFDFHKRFEWERWFLDKDECDDPCCLHQYCNDVRASSKLEVAATQFEVQGLELDWVGVCWGDDLVWTGTEWKAFKFNNKSWRPLKRPSHAYNFRVNGYRVLMTRARQGMILYVPMPNRDDRSRLHEDLDRTFEFLVACGAEAIESRRLATSAT